MSRLLSPSHRLVAVNFFIQLAFQSTYFVGIIGCGTYVLGAGAFERPPRVWTQPGAHLCNVLRRRTCGLLGPASCASSRLRPALRIGRFWPCSSRVLSRACATRHLCRVAVWRGDHGHGRLSALFDGAPEELLRINGLNNIATSVAVIVGPALGGVIASAFSNQGVFFLLAAAPVPALLLVASLREGTAVQGVDKPESRDGATGLRSLWEGVITTAADATCA